jgi:hypothetical protein
MFTSPAATYFGYDEGYKFAKSFQIGVSTNQDDGANFVISLSYSTNAGSSFTNYGTVTVTRPDGINGIDDYTFGPVANFDFSTIQPIKTNLIIMIMNLPNSLMGTVNGGDPVPRIQTLLKAWGGSDANGSTIPQMNARYSFSDATAVPTTVSAVCSSSLDGFTTVP